MMNEFPHLRVPLFNFAQVKNTIDLICQDKNIIQTIHDVGEIICQNMIEQSGQLLICGNGGSAADAQHFAAELVGRYKLERYGLPAIALTTDSSIMTAIANDYGYEHVFAKQVQAFMNTDNDILFGISTSGNSKNVVNAFKCASSANGLCIALTGKNEKNELKELADYCIEVPSNSTPIIQTCHITIIHILCEMIDIAYKNKYGEQNDVLDY